MIVPYGQCQDHSVSESGVHRSKTTPVLERVGIAKGGLLRIAEGVGDGITAGHSGNFNGRVLDDLPVLDVETADFAELAAGGVVGGDELGYDGECLAGVNSLAVAVESLITHAPRVEIATILIANTTVSVVPVTTLGARATVLARNGANVWGIGS